jgi:hypothetical protein
MAGEASWITVGLMMIGVIFIVGLIAFGRSVKGVRRVKLAVQCPPTGHGATVVALQSETSGRYTDVVRCSELHGDVTCGRTCLAQVNPPRAS